MRPRPSAAVLARLAVLVAVATVIARMGDAHDLTGARAPRTLSEEATRPHPPVAPTGPTPAAAADARTFYIANDDHSDYMWSGDDADYRIAFPGMLDYYMNQAEATAANPSDFRGRFSCDGTIWLWVYERTRSAAALDRLVGHVQAGDITVPLNPCVQLYGAMPVEAVLRGFLYAGDLERRFNLPLALVVPMENQTLPGGVASLWAGSGAKYAWKGICNCATPIDATHRARELYRFTGPDGQSVIIKWNSLLTGDSRSIGGYAEARFPVSVIDLMTNDADYRASWPWDVSAAFGYGWDDLQSTTNTFVDAAQSETELSRRVVVSNEIDFFQDVESRIGPSLESWGGSYGNDWDLLPASMAEVSARVRRSTEKLRAAEAMASVVLMNDASFMIGRESARDSAMFSLGLYYEHSWSGGPGVSDAERASWQRSIQRAITGYVDRLHDDAVTELGAQIAKPSGGQRWFVFNPLGWQRTDYADLDLPYGNFRVVDTENEEEVPAQAVTVNGRAQTRILATDVPAVGYKTYAIEPGSPGHFPPSATVTLPGMENDLYRLQLGGHGDITSLEDLKDGGRQLVDGTIGLFDLGSGSGSAQVVEQGPVSTTLQVSAGGDPSHTTKVTLFTPAIDRVAFEGHVNENFGDTQEWTSGFNLAGGTWRHEEVGMIATAKRQSDGGDYADQNARTDWLTLNHFTDLSQTDRGVTVSSWESPFFRLGFSTPTTLDAGSTRMQALVGMHDNPEIGIPNQGGDAAFMDRFALRTHGAWNAPDAMRFSLEHQNPLVAGAVTGVPNAPLPEESYSMLNVSDPDVLLWALKPAQSGSALDLVARAWNLGSINKTVRLHTVNERLAGAREVTHIEQDKAAVTWLPTQLTDDIGGQQIKSWRLKMAGHPTYVPPGSVSSLALSIAPNPVVMGSGGFIRFVLPADGRVTAQVLDVTGRRVAMLADGTRPAGRNEIVWNTGGLRPGIYLVTLDAAGRHERRHAVVLK